MNRVWNASVYVLGTAAVAGGICILGAGVAAYVFYTGCRMACEEVTSHGK